jgi:O-antigen/teichoic acid export membrane protein
MVGPMLWAANAILANVPGGYGELGLINAASQWRTFLMMLPSTFCAAALPIISAEQARPDNDLGYRKVMGLTQGLSLLVVLPLSTLIIFLGDWIMLLYGKDFSEGAPILIGITLGISVSAIGSAAGAGIQAKGMMWFGVLQNLTWGVVLIGFVWCLGPIWGAKSYALGFAVTYLVLLIWSYWVIRSDLPRGMLKRTFSAAGYLVLMSGLSLCLSPPVRQLLALPACGLSVLASFWLLDLELRRSIRGRLRGLAKGDRVRDVSQPTTLGQSSGPRQ